MLKDISSYIHAFEVLFIHRVLDLHATLQALMAMKRLLPDVYRVFTKRRKAYLCPEKVRSLRTDDCSVSTGLAGLHDSKSRVKLAYSLLYGSDP